MQRFSRKLVYFGLFSFLGLMVDAGAFAGGNPSEDVRIKFNVFPWEPVAGQTVEIQGEIVIIGGQYILKSVSQSLQEGGLIVVDVVVEENANPTPNVVSMEPFHLSLGELPAGGYTVLGQINGVAQYKMAFAVYSEPRPTPTPGPKPLLSDASILISPEMPSATDEIRITVNGQFSSARYSIADAKAEILPDAVLLWVNVQEAEIGAEVITPISHEFNIGTMPPGGYAVILYVNGIEAAYNKFMVLGEYYPYPLPEPPTGPYSSRLWIEPPDPREGEEFTVYLFGEFPSTGYTFEDKNIELTDNNTFKVSVKIAEPNGPALTIMTPFREPLGTFALNQGVYEAIGEVNGVALPEMIFKVSGDVPDDPGVIDPNMKSFVIFTREGGFAGLYDSIHIDSSGYFMHMNRIVDSYPSVYGKIPEELWNQLLTALNAADFSAYESVYKPDSEVADGFTYTIAYGGKDVVILQEAAIPETLQTILALLEKVLSLPGDIPDVVPIPDDPVIIDPNPASFLIFTREGGIAGLYDSIQIDSSGYFMRGDSSISSRPSIYGKIPEDLWNELLTALNAADFSAYESVYKPDHEVADGFTYKISYGGKDVVILQEAAIPETLQTILALLEKVLSLPGDIPVIDPIIMPFLIFTREGGIAGLYDSVQIDSSGYFMHMNRIIDSYPSVFGKIPEELWNQLLAALNAADFSAYDPVYKPEFDVADGFTYTIAYGGKEVVILQEAAIPETLQTIQALLEKVLTLPGDQGQGESGIINFNRCGGFAGENSELDLHLDGNFTSNSNIAGNISNNSGAAPDDLMEQLRQSLNETDFSALPPVNKPDNVIADGYVYTLNYKGNEIVVYQGAVVSAPLQETIELLERILNLSNRDGELTKVESWILY
ncbi:MAG: hypothetical protein AB1656_16360 [Candidatus Omnitrophota bacterium]